MGERSDGPALDDARFARELWRRLESIHAVTYFAPETLDAASALGVRGFWRSYFSFRAAPLGACAAGVVEAAFFGFAPGMVARAVPSVWSLAAPHDLIAARSASAAMALRRIAREEVDGLVGDGRTMRVLSDAIDGASSGGLPLFLANRHVDLPDDPVGALWQLATTLREQRGDGHVAAWTARGVAPVEVAVLFVAAGGTAREALQPHRGWTDEEWSVASDRLEAVGLLAAGELSPAGQDLVADVEATTDALAAEPFGPLGAAGRQRLLDALAPAASAVARSGTIPGVNPMGLPLMDET